jgi:hypothetical protein
MNVRIVSEGNNVVGYQVVQSNEPAPPGQIAGGLMAGEKQRVLDIEVPDDFVLVPNPEEIHKRLAAALSKRAAA